MKYILPILVILFQSCSSPKIEQEESYLEIAGNKIHVKTIGKGQPIILAHGGYLDLEMWNPQIDELSKNNQVVRFSDLGHGKSINSGKPIYGYEIIHQLIKNHDNQKSILIGLSWGAMICVDYTLNHPQNVDKLVLVSPGLNGWEYFQDSMANENFLLRQEAIKHADTINAAKLFHKNWVVGPRRDAKKLEDKFLKNSLKMITQTMSNHWGEEWSQLDSITALSRLNEIKVPTYIIIGSEDAMDIIQIASKYHKEIPKSEKTIVNGAAHLINMEHPKKFNDLIKNIIKK
jgi:pimeloyl-ACP methyl ester carboxylesterase